MLQFNPPKLKAFNSMIRPNLIFLNSMGSTPTERFQRISQDTGKSCKMGSVCSPGKGDIKIKAVPRVTAIT